VGGDQWLIGRRTSSGWITDAAASATINPLTDYYVRLTLDGNGAATLYADGVLQVSRQYGDTLTDGAVGLGTSNALSRFDNLAVQSLESTQAQSRFASDVLVAGLSFSGETIILPRRAGAAPPIDGREAVQTPPTPLLWLRQTAPIHAPPGDARRLDEAFAQLADRRDEWESYPWSVTQSTWLF
jgi:hypothetical protein